MVASGDIDVYGGNGVSGKHDQCNLSGENIIIGCVGAKCGNVHRVEGDVWVTDNALYVSEYTRPFDAGFLTRLLRFQDLRGRANQAAQPVISYTTIKAVLLSFPDSLSLQGRIERSLGDLDTETHRLAALYQRKLSALEALKKSILHQAFTGQLSAAA
jgi:type I restriction enzyme S subunit